MLIDNGASLNILSVALLRQLEYSKDSIDPHHKITIKAYDEVKHKYLDFVVLPL